MKTQLTDTAATRNQQRRWSTSDCIVVAVVAAAFGTLALFYGVLSRIAGQVLGLYGGYLVGGLFHAPGICLAYALRKPWVAFVTQNLFGVTQLLFGNPDGAIVLWFTFFESLAQELIFFPFRGQSHSLLTVGVAGAASLWAAQIPTYFIYSFHSMPTLAWLLPIVAVGMPSSVAFCVGLAIASRRLLLRTRLVRDVPKIETQTK